MKNEQIHVGALSLTKTADGLIDPKLVLAWLLSAIGAPGFLIGLLVPVREAGALLPQLALAGWIEAARVRKFFWAAGAALQGLAALAMAASVLLLPGGAAGWACLGGLALLACARALCSVSYKDVLARSVEKGARGKVSGLAGTVSAIIVFAFALLLATGIIPRTPGHIAAAIALAGLLWLVAAALFTTLRENPDDPQDAEAQSLPDLLAPLTEDAELRRYIATRALLISTALAPPFVVMLGSGDGVGFANLGLLLLASSIAAIVSSYLWGALSDRSSRQTLMLAGGLAALALGAGALAGLLVSGVLGSALVAGIVFANQIAYQGARAGRKTHLTDMDTEGRKATYTALSNSMIGVLLLAGGSLGLLADAAGPAPVLALLALLSAAAIVSGAGLSEVQQEG